MFLSGEAVRPCLHGFSCGRTGRLLCALLILFEFSKCLGRSLVETLVKTSQEFPSKGNFRQEQC